jgi:hypothetical protein
LRRGTTGTRKAPTNTPGNKIPDSPNSDLRFAELTQRYTGATPETLMAVLCPLLVPISALDRTILKLPGQEHYRASFKVRITDENRVVLQRGRTGKFVPHAYVNGTGVWREICKGRIVDADAAAGVASGEVYTGGRRPELDDALAQLTEEDYLEVDQYGASAKVLSGLAEYFLVQLALTGGYSGSCPFSARRVAG